MSENDFPPEEFSPEIEAELVAYADGRLPAAQEAALEALFEEDPALAQAAERQRAAGDLIVAAAGSVEAPTWLRIELDTLQARSMSTARRRRRRLAWRPLAGLAAAAAVLALVLVVTLGGSGLTVEQAAAIGTRAPTASVSPDPARPKLLAAEVDGVTFPDYAAKFGWTAVGQRSDEIDGREMRTVFYEREGERIAYTIIAGDPLDEPGDAEASTRDGVTLLQFDDGERTVVTWQRLGHTCVLSGSGVDAETLLELAAWKGLGSVAF